MRTNVECIFCRLVRGEIPSDRVYEDDQIIAFRDIQPAAPVHILIIPREHVESVSDLREDDAALAGALLLVAGSIAEREGLTADGYRVISNTGESAGQTVSHLHLHLLGGRPLGALG
jgi:histidine triad (HIT) family protein